MQGARALFFLPLCHIPISCARAGVRARRGAALRGSGYRLSFIHSAAEQAAWGGRTPPPPTAQLLAAQPQPKSAGVAVPEQQKSELSRANLKNA